MFLLTVPDTITRFPVARCKIITQAMHEAPSVKMGSVFVSSSFFPLFYLFFHVCRLPVFMLIVGEPTIITFFACASGEERTSEVCFVCLTCLNGLFVRTLISRTNAHSGCGRAPLNLIERF